MLISSDDRCSEDEEEHEDEEEDDGDSDDDDEEDDDDDEGEEEEGKTMTAQPLDDSSLQNDLDGSLLLFCSKQAGYWCRRIGE